MLWLGHIILYKDDIFKFKVCPALSNAYILNKIF